MDLEWVEGEDGRGLIGEKRHLGEVWRKGV